MKNNLITILSSTLILFSISAIGQTDSTMQKLTISKNSHYINMEDRIIAFRSRPEKVEWNYIFQENCNYNLGDADQLDWNKLTGLYFNMWNTRAETVMVGWRYNVETDNIELCAYYHVNKGRHFTKPLLTVKRGELVNVKIEVDYQKKNYTVTLANKEKTVSDSYKFFHNRSNCGQINFFFGGNRTAPQEVSVLMEMVSNE